ncbi:CoA transferase [Fangia hongkongensis]|nr:CoA transferase [Fangia hongkongensis]
MFNHLKVVEIATVLAGPSVGMFFAELGAEVIKIESPHKPDSARSWHLPDESKDNTFPAYFCATNYNKQYIQLDFKNQQDLLKLYQLVADADVIISNFRASSAKKLKIDYDALSAINPRLIYAQISGYGQDSERVAFDIVLQAETGFMSMTGWPDSPPAKLPVALIDILAGHQLKEGVLTALYQRERTNKGALVHVSLYDAAIASLENQATNWLMAGYLPKREGSLHPNIAPYGEVYHLKDGVDILLSIGNDFQFGKFCEAMKMKELIMDPRFKTNQARLKNRPELNKIIAESILMYSSEELLNICESKKIPVGKINNMKEVFEQEKAQALILEEKMAGTTTRRVKTVVFSIN